MVHPDLLEILRCPACVREPGLTGALTLHKDCWLVCAECGRKYPIVKDIPVMLLDEGAKWVNTAVDQLPVPPPDIK
ncbi:MAG TPA: Trm112 family protein [Anaerolineaceae bacterium]